MNRRHQASIEAAQAKAEGMGYRLTLDSGQGGYDVWRSGTDPVWLGWRRALKDVWPRIQEDIARQIQEGD